MKKNTANSLIFGGALIAAIVGCSSPRPPSPQSPAQIPDTARDVRMAEILAGCEALIFDRSPVVLVLERDIEQTKAAHHMFLKYLEDNYSEADFESITDQMFKKMAAYTLTDHMKKLKNPDGFLNTCRELPSRIINLHR